MFLAAQRIGAAVAAGTVRYVSTSGSDTLNDCTDSANACATIAYAINQSNAGDTIEIAAGTYTEQGITVNEDLSINGHAASDTIVQAAATPGTATGRVFNISSGTTVTISGLTIRNGRASGSSPAGDGGGIYSDHATLTLNSCAVSGNSAEQLGGGIVNNSFGSGSATLTINNSTLSGNSAVSFGGGGIFSDGRGGNVIVTINNSTLSGNSTSNVGGGIWNDGNSGSATLTIKNSTLSGNSSGSNGGGIFSDGANGSALVTIGDTILKAGTSGVNIFNGDGTVTSLGYNLSSDAGVTNSGGTGALNATGDQINTDPKLGSLADNGGPTKTHALLPGSSAIDQGKDFTTSTTDQRGPGFPRTFDDPALTNASSGDGTDIGAYEFKDTDGDGVEDFRDNCPSIPNPEKIAFASDRDGNYEIHVMNADGSNPINLSQNPETDNQPAFSHDGSKIAFVSTRDDANGEIYVMNADGTNPIRLTNNVTDDTKPAFSPDDSKIVFTSGRDGDANIYVMNADGTNPTRLTDDPAFDSDPSFSPDGSKIVFTSDRDGNFGIYVMNADGSNPTRLTNSATVDTDSRFSPDGSKIVFGTNRDGNFELYVMNADGSDPTSVTNNGASDFNPSWGAQPAVPPTINSVSARPNVISIKKKNGKTVSKTVPVTVDVSVTDNCDPSVQCQITDVTYNGPAPKPGQRPQITGDLTVQLTGDRIGRRYTITVRCRDSLGNSATKTTTVRVVRRQGG